MKKIIALLLTAALIFGIIIIGFSIHGKAEEYNYFDMDAIEPRPVAPCKGTRVYRKSVDGESAYAVTGINYRYNSVGFDILPAVKAALGDKSYARITISFQIKADWTEEFTGHSTTCKAILRCMNPGGSVYNAELWNSSYKNSLILSDPIFNNYDGQNVIGYFTNKRVLLTDNTWVTYSVDMLVERTQVYSNMTPDWTFCFDEMNGSHQPTEKEKDSQGLLKIFDEVLIKNVSICLSENQTTPTPAPTQKPTEKPTAKPTATVTEAPTNEQNDDSNNETFNLIWICAIVGAVVGASIGVVRNIVKKKAPDGENNQ